MHDIRHFQPTQRAFVKQSLVLFTIILVLVPVVYAEDDKWIDGIMYRLANSGTTISLKIHNDQGNIHFDEIDSMGILSWPIIITFPETLMNSWSYRGLYIDYQLPIEKKDLRTKKGGYVNSTEKEWIYNKFFNSTDKAFADENPNWSVTADAITSRFILGYTWGVFWPRDTSLRFMQGLATIGISELIGPIRFNWPNIRLFKGGLGLSIIYENYSYKLNLCSQLEQLS